MVETRQYNSTAKDRVLDAAYSLFVRSGYTDVSMQQIADEASITKATLYHHFRDKQDLYIETMWRAFARNETVIAKTVNSELSLRETLLILMEMAFSTERTDFQRLVTDFRQYIDKETQEAFWSQFRKPWILIQPAVERAITNGEITTSDAAFASRFLYGTIAGMAQIMRFDKKGDATNHAIQEELANTMMRGLGGDITPSAIPE